MKRTSILYLLLISLIATNDIQASQPYAPAYQSAQPSFWSSYTSALPGACGTWAAQNTANIIGGIGLIAAGVYIYRRITRMERHIAEIKARTTKIQSDVEEIKPVVHATHKKVTELGVEVDIVKTTTNSINRQMHINIIPGLTLITNTQGSHDQKFKGIFEQIKKANEQTRQIKQKQDETLDLVRETHAHIMQQQPVQKAVVAKFAQPYLMPMMFRSYNH
ncbi:MAG: hypothetical protein P4L31_07995 [Candidatus Babeliales bacterium]|nr:hypothetical protein [Candidatus Babeliales bacterium]